MRRFVAILFLIHFATSAYAQSLATAERAPKVKALSSVTSNKEGFIYMGFIHSTSQPCKLTTRAIIQALAPIDNISLVLFTREQPQSYATWLNKLKDSGVAIYPNAKNIFKKYGVDYAPLGVILDAMRRVLWFGNPQSLSSEEIVKIINKWTSQR